MGFKRAIVLLSLISLCLLIALVLALNPPHRSSPAWQPSRDVERLTEKEVSEALALTRRDPSLQSILSQVNWTLVEAGPWSVGGERVGAVLLIRISEPVWISGTFREPGGSPYRAELWLGSLHVFVNLKEGKIEAISPSMARALRDPPGTSEKYEQARRVALSWLPGSRSAFLNGVFYTAEFAEGLAFFRVEDALGESLVAVNLARMAVEERYTARVVPGG